MIYENSRFTHTRTLITPEGKKAFKIREVANIAIKDASTHVWAEPDRLDLLALKYYNNPQLWWVILDANSGYYSEHDIKYGEVLIIPLYEEVIRWLNQY